MDLTLLKKTVETPGAPGHETPIRAYIREQVEPHVDEVTTDSIGNLIARVKGDGPKVMMAAHMDEISLITTHVDDKDLSGFLPWAVSIPKRWLISGCGFMDRKQFRE